MYYKLSNTASIEHIENEFNAQFRYPKLYQSNPMINGFKEESVQIITSENTNEIIPGIWGLLPRDFEDDWTIFQNINNTLNIEDTMLHNKEWCENEFSSKRCLVIITGFFTSYINKGTIYPYYVFNKLNKPFSVGGLCNKLNDGFRTCTILVSEANNFIKNIHNINVKMPLIIPKNKREEWLNNKDINLDAFTFALKDYKLQAHPIAKELFKNDIVYESMLEPVDYEGIPKSSW